MRITEGNSPTIAIIGASTDRCKFGNRAVRAYARRGYTVYPINPRHDTVEGLPAYRTIGDVPLEKLDRVSMYVPPQIGMTIIEDLARKSVGEVWFNPGSESHELITKAKSFGLNVVTGCSILDIDETP